MNLVAWLYLSAVLFAIGRVPGWVVQVLEQLENNILIRPLTLYSGPDARAYVPLEKRGG